MNTIMGAVYESISVVFSNAINAIEMLDALVNKYESNDQILRIKLTGSETRF